MSATLTRGVSMPKPKISSEGTHVARCLLDAARKASERGDAAEVVAAIRGWKSAGWKLDEDPHIRKTFVDCVTRASTEAVKRHEDACTRVALLACAMTSMGWHLKEGAATREQSAELAGRRLPAAPLGARASQRREVSASDPRRRRDLPQSEPPRRHSSYGSGGSPPASRSSSSERLRVRTFRQESEVVATRERTELRPRDGLSGRRQRSLQRPTHPSFAAAPPAEENTGDEATVERQGPLDDHGFYDEDGYYIP